jgi:RNA polymerase sigma factor (sigma-70 family)
MTALQKCREQLPERARRLVDLYYERGRSVKEVCAELEMGAEAVKQALFRLRRMLQDCIEGHSIAPDSL